MMDRELLQALIIMGLTFGAVVVGVLLMSLWAGGAFG